MAAGAPNTPFGILNRPDTRRESLEQYLYRRVDPNHFAALDGAQRALFEDFKSRFSKSYATADEEALRLRNFVSFLSIGPSSS